jgi:hypothetical protein
MADEPASDDDDAWLSDGDFELDDSAPPSSSSQAVLTCEIDGEPPECAVCTDMFWQPVRLPACGHIFCRHCVVEVERRGSNYENGPTATRCPLCRQAILDAGGAEEGQTTSQFLAGLPVDEALESRLRHAFPEVWQRRQAEAELRTACSMAVCVGNRIGTPARRSSPDDEVSWTIFVEVAAPAGWSERHPRSSGGGGGGGGGGITGRLVECVRVVLPAEQTPEGSGLGDGYVEIDDAPYELRGLAAPGELGEFTATVQVFWQRRLKVPPLAVQHRVRLREGGSAASHEVALPNGLTLARVLERTRPKAIVGVGTANESRVY